MLARWTLIRDIQWIFYTEGLYVIDVPYRGQTTITIVHLVTASGVRACMQ